MKRKLCFEQVEGRCLLAGVTTLPSGDVQIDGTENADLIQVTKVDVDTIRVRIGSTIQNVDIAVGKKVIINGLGGDDYITMANTERDSYIDAGNGNDYVAGGVMSDEIHGGQGNDRINGGNGDDLLFAGLGTNTVDGGGGTDSFYAEGGTDSLSAIEFIF